jgi:hypothetical protein
VSRNAITLQSKIENNSIPITECGCWFWLGCLNGDGYGGIKIAGRSLLAHRASWETFNGPIPDGLCVLHRCDIPCCVNPDHLFIGTQLENIEDRTRKGRGRKIGYAGEAHPLAIMTAEDVKTIRASQEQQDVLAGRYGVSQAHISNIVRRKKWKHVP